MASFLITKKKITLNKKLLYKDLHLSLIYVKFLFVISTNIYFFNINLRNIINIRIIFKFMQNTFT